MSTIEENLKLLRRKEITLALTNVNNGREHYYTGDLLGHSEEVITLLCFVGSRFREKRKKVIINRRAYTIDYIQER